MSSRLLVVLLLLLLPKPLEPTGTATTPPSETGRQPRQVASDYGKPPLSFEPNQGQTDSRVGFLARGEGYTLFLTNDEAVFSLRGSKANDGTSHTAPCLLVSPRLLQVFGRAQRPTSTVLRMKLVNANRAAEITGADELPGKSNYFLGNDPKRWRKNVATYAKVKYRNLYPGIDLVYYGNQRQLEYDFVVAPGADPRRIQFDVRGAKHISRDEHGDLVLQVDEGELRCHKPVVYQEKVGRRQEIAAHYVIKDKNRVGFVVADYDLRRPLFIDPLIYSTYLGGSGDDSGNGIAVDSSGSAYVTGWTVSTDFPTMNPLQPAKGGSYDAFVTKLNPTGSALVYSTYLGGSQFDAGFGIAVDSSGNAYVIGQTSSTDFPTMNPLQPNNAGGSDAFVAKLNPTGSALVYSTYLGGSAYDVGQGIAVDSSGNAHVTGYTSSTDFPTVNPLQPNNAGGGYDAFVAKLNPAGSALVYSTYLGGSAYDTGQGIAVDSSGNTYVTGVTASTDFPTMNPLQPNNAGGYDAFVAQLNPTGSALVYSTYLGGSGGDVGFGIAVDSSGNAYLTGNTASTNFPTMNPLQPAYGGGGDAFVAQLNPTGSALVYSTYLGGSLDDYASGIAVDKPGNAYVMGSTNSTNFPTMNPLQPNNAGNFDAFVAKIAKPSAFVTLVPTKLDFGKQTVGITSTPQHSTLTNIGEFTLTITSIKVTGSNSSDFAEKDNCGTSIPPKGKCKITVTFTPTAIGSRIAAVSITDNAPDSPQMLPLSGMGVLPAVMLSPARLTFHTQVTFTTSKARLVTLTNTGQGILLISQIAASGEFIESNDCPKSMQPEAHCTIRVKFHPINKGEQKGTLSVTDNAPSSPQTVPLAGTGTFVQLVPTKLNFGTQPVGTKSLPKRITLTNKGDAAVNIRSISIKDADAGDFAQTNNCGNQVPPGASCFIKVTFKPLKKGKRTADVSVSDDGGGSPQKVSLIGTGT